jgi:hypothetical protein
VGALIGVVVALIVTAPAALRRRRQRRLQAEAGKPLATAERRF